MVKCVDQREELGLGFGIAAKRRKRNKGRGLATKERKEHKEGGGSEYSGSLCSLRSFAANCLFHWANPSKSNAIQPVLVRQRQIQLVLVRRGLMGKGDAGGGKCGRA